MKQLSSMKYLLAVLLLPLCAEAMEIQLVAAGQDKATIMINGGKPKTIRLGQAPVEGISLIQADANSADFRIDNKRHHLIIGGIGRVGGTPSVSAQSDGKKLTLQADGRGHFWTTININGLPLRGLIDTGATSIALSSQQARQIGLEYRQGTQSNVSTASGTVPAYNVVINEIRVGDMVLYQIPAMVLEGAYPQEPLIGNTLLSRLNMNREGDLLTLSKRY